ncbi:GNAT family N-acetyltransferase [Jannaschia sp. W003]|uniref:GNAT family N-acetyltransferase n=1 Tax=Jannaschia sp. W003 TaxID=2867012 RepID=UPI0021A931C1|nr:GNAT family N-acetyltransferase [Jannaschia sp. W003]UWQ20697.1 GNAT family N-acetyltransferase [Jannaschia sp. W003]
MDLSFGQWRVRLRPDGPALASAHALRAAMFRGGRPDRDRFDAGAEHLTIHAGDRLAACARLMPQDRAGMLLGYAAERYDLRPLVPAHARAVELGRVCLALPDPELPRVLLAALGRVVAARRATLLYGCASFGPSERAALGRMRPHVARTGPGRASPDAVPLPLSGTGTLPPLLRLYLAFGATVSDHAVQDPDLGTVHVLAMLDRAAIPPARLRSLRALAPEGVPG